eukprot:TRINITY_DN1178_c0_g1_i2.p2 TRINITY_DN1178_c0_g1~~TRINITY_DN1178_c0_g1_i2.p2  ORF type:complete len:109 (-),score=1.47 TRINITY_DN1178_c0_g1_i2:55-381(-)
MYSSSFHNLWVVLVRWERSVPWSPCCIPLIRSSSYCTPSIGLSSYRTPSMHLSSTRALTVCGGRLFGGKLLSSRNEHVTEFVNNDNSTAKADATGASDIGYLGCRKMK